MLINILGIDPSLRNFGLVNAVLDTETMKFQIKKMNLVKSEDSAKAQKTVRKNSDDLRRSKLLYEGLQDACKEATFACVEIPVGSQTSRAMASYGICIGVLASCPIPLIQVTPTEVKLAGTMNKTATKAEMIAAAVAAHPEAQWLTRKLKGNIELVADNEHLADATFAIEAGLKTEQFKGMLTMLKTLKV